MSAMASQITGVSVVYSTICSGTDQRKPKSPALLAFVRGIHRWPVNSPHTRPVTRNMFSFDVITLPRSFRITSLAQEQSYGLWRDICFQRLKGLWELQSTSVIEGSWPNTIISQEMYLRFTLSHTFVIYPWILPVFMVVFPALGLPQGNWNNCVEYG